MKLVAKPDDKIFVLLNEDGTFFRRRFSGKGIYSFDDEGKAEGWRKRHGAHSVGIFSIQGLSDFKLLAGDQ